MRFVIQKKHYSYGVTLFTLIIALGLSLFLFLQSNNSPTFAAGPTVTTVDSTVGDVGRYTSTVLGGDGFPRISYYDGTNADLKFAQCTNASCSSKTLTTIDSTNDVGQYSSIALGADGFARISYLAGTTVNPTQLKFVQCTDASCSTNTITTVDSTAGVFLYTSIAMAGDGYARIAYQYNTSGDLKYIQCTNADCSTNVKTDVDTTGDVGSDVSIKVASDGFARISYSDGTNGDLKYAQCTNADCSTHNITTVDSTGNVGSHTSLALGSDDFGRIAYRDVTNSSTQSLKYAQCTNADCSTHVLTSIANTPQAGQYTAIRLDSSGYARISMREQNFGYLQYVQCTNVDCSTNVLSVVDNNFVGLYTSMTIDASGFVGISYYSGNTLRYALCSDTTCGNAPTAPTTLYSNTYANGAQSGSANPTTLDSKDIVVSAIHNDADGDVANKYQVQVSTDNTFGTTAYDSGSNGTSMTSTANGARSPNIGIPITLSENTTYYWRIRFKDTIGNVGAYSPSGGSAASFKTTAVLTPAITTLDSTGTVGQYTGITMGSDGFARISYYDVTNADLKFIQCTNATCTTKVTTTIDSTGTTGQHTSIAMGSDGFARIAYKNISGGATNDDPILAQCTNDTCSSNVLTIVDSTGNAGADTSMAMGSDGFARIFYTGNNGLFFVQCTNASCSTSVVTNTAADTFGTDTSMTLGTDGFGRVSYYISNTLKYMQCTNTSCSTSVRTVVDSTANVGSHTSIAVASDGFARISYYDVTNGDLKYLQCTNADCSTNVKTTVDSSGNVGQYTSLSLGSDDFGRISYYDVTNGDLKYVRCTNAACSTSAITVVNGAGNVGQYTSMVLGSDGFARISYYDITNTDLKFAQCSNATCTSAPANSAPTAPTILYSNNATDTAQAGTTNPTTLSSESVVFSALYNDSDVGDIANKYQLQISTDNTFATTVYDSGGSGTSISNITAGIRSSDITPTGFTPVDTTIYYWRIKFWDDDSAEGVFSPSGGSAASFTLTLPTISFDIDTALTDSESTQPYTIALGTLSPDTLTTSNDTTINSIYLDLSSNASNGTTVTLAGGNGGLYSPSKNHLITLETPEDIIASAQEKFGLCVASVTQSGGSGTFSASANYDAEGTSNCTTSNGGVPKVGKVNTTETPIVSVNGTLIGGRAQILTKASITSVTPAGSDYSEVLTFIATGVY